MVNEKQTKSGIFDFLHEITVVQSKEYFDNLSDVDRGAYKASRYMINRFLSMNPHYLPIINTLQQYGSISDRAHYLFLIGIIPRGKQYNKYIKGKRDNKYESWLVDLVANHFHVSRQESIDYIDIYYTHDKKSLRELCEKFGIDNKLIKKAKL
jgi:hypothetical protein